MNAYERWAVASNLRTIREGNATAKDQVALLRANGYLRIAEAVERAST